MTQDEALALLKTGASIFLTGQPGSGKTHTVNRYIQWLKRQGIEFAYTASTGIAATHGHGVTIHAWSGIGVRETLTRPRSRYARRQSEARHPHREDASAGDRRDLDAAGAEPRPGRCGLPPHQGRALAVRRAADRAGRRFLPAAAGRAPRRASGDAAARRRRRPVRRGVRPCLLGLARSRAHGLLSVGAAPAERQAVSRCARRHPRQCLRRHSPRAACRAADRQGPAARGLHAAVHA